MCALHKLTLTQIKVDVRVNERNLPCHCYWRSLHLLVVVVVVYPMQILRTISSHAHTPISTRACVYYLS